MSYFYSLTHEYPIFPVPFIEETFSIEYSWLPCQTLFDCMCLGLILGSQFCFTGLCVYTIDIAPHCFNYCSSRVQFEIRTYDTFCFALLSQDSFGYSWSVVVLKNFRSVFFFFFSYLYIYIKKTIEILIGTAKNLQMIFVSIAILEALILPINEYLFIYLYLL